jgi:hypothetical protein
MSDLRTSTCSAASEDSPLPQDGPDTAPSDSVRSTNGASESSENTGQLSLSGMTCEALTERPLWPTPTAETGGSHPEGGHILLDWAVTRPAFRLTSSPQAIPASHSHSPGSDWARKMTATYGRRFADYWLSSDPPDSWVRTLLATSVWGSTMCYLTWKRSATPQGRLLFRLVPSTHHTGGIASGFWPTPNEGDNRDRGHKNMPAIQRRIEKGKQIMLSMEVQQARGEKLNSAWVNRMMGYPDGWLILDGEETP